MHELRGETVAHEVDPELNLDVDALLPDEYIERHRRPPLVLQALRGRRRAKPDVEEIAAEMEDRFGARPGSAPDLRAR